MRSESSEKRGRQKVVRLPTYRIENEYNPEAMPQYFQNFVFELYTNVRDLQQSSLWLAVMEPRFYAPPRMLGEANIDLGAIWIKPHHQVLSKWAQLCLLGDPTAGPVGFLQVDVSIILRGETYSHIMPALIRDDKFEDDLLLPSNSEQQCANYLVTIYGAFGLPNSSKSQSDKRFGKPPSTFVRVSFCGLMARTATFHGSNNPTYNEKISMVEMFPNMRQFIRFEVCSSEGHVSRVLACAQLMLQLISHDGDNGFLPTFGPSLLHMYGGAQTYAGTLGVMGEDGPYYRGSLFVALNTTVPYYQQALRSITVEPVAPLNLEHLWKVEDFCIFCPIFEVSILDRQVAGKLCGVAITMAEVPYEVTGEEEFTDMMNEIRAHKMHYTGCLDVYKNEPIYGYLDFSNSFPVLQLATRLPDFRFKMYRNNMIQGIVTKLNLAISEVKRRLVCFDYSSPSELMEELNTALDDACGNIVKFVDILHCSIPSIDGSENSRQYSTELDLKQLALQKEEIEKIHQQILRKFTSCSRASLIPSSDRVAIDNTATKKTVKQFLQETQNVAQNLGKLIYKGFEGWPDIIIWLLNGGSRVAYTKISAADIIHSAIQEQSGKDCGRIQNVYLKPLKCPRHAITLATGCHCIAGKVEFLMWMGLYRQRSALKNYLPSGYQLKVKDYDMRIKSTAMMVECRAFVYKAKLRSDSNVVNTMQTFVRINSLSMVKETKVKCRTLSPEWNQVLKINKMVFMTPERLFISPPIVLVEVNNTDLSGKTELIGRSQILPAVEDNQDYESAPKLQWYNLSKGTECTGQVLMAVQILQIPEKLLKTTMYGSVEECCGTAISISKEKDAICDVETIPPNLLPISTSYKVDVYWWGLRDINLTKKPGVMLEIEEVVIKSEVIANKQSSCNFPDGRTSVIFEAAFNESYSPVLKIRLFDSSTFGRTLYLGTKIVKNPTKYIVNWLPKTERESSLRRTSIMSSDFFQVNQVLFIKRSSQSRTRGSYYESNNSTKIPPLKWNDKCLKWRKMFWFREQKEEECTLLPMLATKKDRIVIRNTNDEETDWWWLKYLRSDNGHNDEEKVHFTDKLTIYKSELESQPEFSKFKDWCSSLKLYNGKKTGFQEKDEKLYCGILKAGIAIYKWPPPANTIAVTDSGVDLTKGFFDDHPSNNPAKFLIRVYLVKGYNLKTKYYIGKSDPYVLLSCGKKQLGGRYSYVSNTLNPIFGRMYEFRCYLPEDYLLTISLYNYESAGLDEFIGCTSIDLEDRIYSKHRARVGLPSEYSMLEKYKWRDCMKPSTILEELCLANHLPRPVFTDSMTVMVNGVEYKDAEREKTTLSALERKENLCLSILRNWHTLPICGYHLVPEHVETRTLYNPERPGADQGKLHMWVDIFPLDTAGYIPSPIDISPRKVEDYELRLTIYSVQAFVSQSNNPSRKISDFYIKAYLGSMDQAQRTDVHYQCVNGESNFNCRMIFNFQYLPVVRKLVRKGKGVFTEYEENIAPLLTIKLMDSEALRTDDYLGSLVLNLSAVPRGAKQITECTLDVLKNPMKINLFSTRSLRAWWPLSTIDQDSGTSLLSGKIDLEIVLLQQENANIMPVGIGRNASFVLSEPIWAEDKSNRFYCFSNKIPRLIWILTVCILFLSIVIILYFQLPTIIEYWLF